jgi:hypothetical protein
MSRKSDPHEDPNFVSWYAKEKSTPFSVIQLEKEEKRIKKLVLEEVRFLQNIQRKSPKLYPLTHKQIELNEWLPSVDKKQIAWVDRLTWRPTGVSDFRRIEPILVQVNKPHTVQSFNIWGEESTKLLVDNESLSLHWNIIKTLVSSAPNDGTVGRQIYFLVVDKNTKTYLGIICISSSLFDVKSIHDSIGWDRKNAQLPNSKMRNVANGQTIVATRFFGELLRGGKLLALLCTSKEVADAWEENYGDKLVSVHTTSLYGDTDGTQYDGLEPYFYKLPAHPAQPIKPRNHIYKQLVQWMRERHPEEYWKHFYKKNSAGNLMRDNKTRAILRCYKFLGIAESEFATNEKRGVYNSFLYKNAKDFLSDRISVNDLIPADHFKTIAEITHFWRYGDYGDTTKRKQKYVDELNRVPKNDLERRKKLANRINQKVQMQSFVKGVVDRKANSSTRLSEMKYQGKFEKVDWYLGLEKLSWDEIETKFFAQQLPNQKQSQVLSTSDPESGMNQNLKTV